MPRGLVGNPGETSNVEGSNEATVLAGNARRQAAVNVWLWSRSPSPLHVVLAAATAAAKIFWASVMLTVMLGDADNDTAAWNRAFDPGEASNAKIEVPPLLCPSTVTLLLSPPNERMFS